MTENSDSQQTDNQSLQNIPRSQQLYNLVSDIASGDIDVNEEINREIARLKLDSTDHLNLFLLATARRKIGRSDLLSRYVSDLENRLFDNIDALTSNEQIQLLRLAQSEQSDTLQFIQSLVSGKTPIGDAESTDGDVHLHLHNKTEMLGVNVDSSSRETVRQIMFGVLDKVKQAQNEQESMEVQESGQDKQRN